MLIHGLTAYDPPPPGCVTQLAKTLGVVKLIVVVNKLDDHSVVGPDGKQWDQNRCGGPGTQLLHVLVGLCGWVGWAWHECVLACVYALACV